jgi:hypothetical protein
VIGERAMVQRDIIQRSQVLREMQRLQHLQRSEPVSLPSPRTPHRVRVTAG